MSSPHPFHFGVVQSEAISRTAWAEYARKIEGLGYGTLAMGEHPGSGGLAPIPALMAAADVTTTLRLATHVIANDFHHPVILANAITTLDLLSDGRVEFGLGAGWLANDYTATGVRFDSPATRVRRLGEAVRLFKHLCGDEPVTFRGEFYQVEGVDLQPKPLQRPHPPLFIGGGGRQVLGLAAREANIVGLHSKAVPGGGFDVATRSAAAFDQKVRWLREAAGERFADLELNTHVLAVNVGVQRRQGAEELLQWITNLPPGTVTNVPTLNDVLDAPYALFGTVDDIVETLQERRERFGISNITVNGGLEDEFAPVVARLAGT